MPLLPDAGDALAKRYQAGLLKGIAEADALFVRDDRSGEDADLAFRPAFPTDAVVVGIANVDLVGAEPADQPIGGPKPAVGRAHDGMIGVAVPQVAINQADQLTHFPAL